MTTSFVSTVHGFISDIGAAVRDPRARARVTTLGLGFLCGDHPKTVTSAISWLRSDRRDWSSDYRLLSQAKWRPDDLFRPIIFHALDLDPDPSLPIFSAQDDTLARKSGRRIPGTAFARDPLSPPFHVNLVLGQRFLQTALLIKPSPAAHPYRAIPVAFHHAPPLKAPPRATAEQKRAVTLARKLHNLATIANAELHRLRAELDRHPTGARRPLINSVDGSFANRAYLRSLPPRTTVVVRVRKDARFRVALPTHLRRGNRKYGAHLPTPEDMLRDPQIPFHFMTVFSGGRSHTLQYKVVSTICWPRVTSGAPLQLILIKPFGYHLRAGSRLLFRQPAFLLVIGDHVDIQLAIRAYLARWEIEVSFRDEKFILGVGKAQVWNPLSVSRTPAFIVACYACILLASLRLFNDRRTDVFHPLPPWRRNTPLRPSMRDLVALLRRQARDSFASSGLLLTSAA